MPLKFHPGGKDRVASLSCEEVVQYYHVMSSACTWTITDSHKTFSIYIILSRKIYVRKVYLERCD